MTWDEYFMRHVYLVASKSKDPSTKIGAVIIKDLTVVSEGYNGFPRGVHDLADRLHDRDTRLSYTCHGESNAVINCARNGIASKGCTLYTNAFPCDSCMKQIIQSGIKDIIVHSPFHKLFYERTGDYFKPMEAQNMANEAGVEIRYYNNTLNIETLLGGKLVKV